MEKSVIEWLFKAARRWPDKTAYADEKRKITFAELAENVCSIGSGLYREANPSGPVVVMTGRHVLTPACYLGVAAIGCFYAPIDPQMPIPRLNQMLKVISSGLMLVDRENSERAGRLDFDGQILVMEDIAEKYRFDDVVFDCQQYVQATDPLYVLFTSGSTGMPKGVVTSNQSLMCYIESVSEVLDLHDWDILGCQAPLDYIAAIRDIYLPLYTGAKTVIIPKRQAGLPDELFDTLNRERVTTICWSSAGLELPARMGAFDEKDLPYLKKVMFSGSVIPGKYLRIWQQHLPQATFFNQYGPTEATASCTYYKVTEKVNEDTVLPIGIPYKHYRILLLNEDLTPTPFGEIGEICVGGPCVALGYYGNPEKTEAAFIQNPLNSKYRDIIYRTGDLGRRRRDGDLEFLGRKDRQIKHMGHRIELDEIEGCAMQIDGVDDCCALYDKEKELLHLFYAGSAQARDITLYFRQQLPAFMVPRRIRQLEEMPRLANGKKDMQILNSMM